MWARGISVSAWHCRLTSLPASLSLARAFNSVGAVHSSQFLSSPESRVIITGKFLDVFDIQDE
jgi:hypothetical protein